MPAKGTAEWKGDVPTGAGTFTAGDTITGEYSAKSRFEDGPGANPEQLIAAAHASCFTMALANMLAQAGTPADSVKTEATVTLRFVDGVPTITTINLVTVGSVPESSEEDFGRHAAAAKAGCPSAGLWPASRRSRWRPRSLAEARAAGERPRREPRLQVIFARRRAAPISLRPRPQAQICPESRLTGARSPSSCSMPCAGALPHSAAPPASRRS